MKPKWILLFLFLGLTHLANSQILGAANRKNNDIKLSALPYYSFGKGLGITSPDSLFQFNIRFRMQNRVSYFEKEDEKRVVRIDADEIRERLPGYTGENSYIFQGACSLFVNKLHDSVLHNKQNFILDGTFSNYDISCDNIKISVNKNRKVLIFYLYQDPIIAWGFTKKREILEGRNIPKESFIRQLFMAKENVNKVKEIFGKKVQIYLIDNDFITGLKKMSINIDNIDNHISIRYTKSELESVLS
jgi:hypothetical protein